MMTRGSEIDPETLMVKLLRESLTAGQDARLAVLSGSMRPLMYKGEHIVVSACDMQDLQPHDIVVVAASPYPYVHRYCATLTQAGQDYLITRGDYTLVYDPAWPAKSLMGRVVAVEKHTGVIRLDSAGGRQFNNRYAQLLEAEARLIHNDPIDFATLVEAEPSEDVPKSAEGLRQRISRNLYHASYRLLLRNALS